MDRESLARLFEIFIYLFRLCQVLVAEPGGMQASLVVERRLQNVWAL